MSSPAIATQNIAGWAVSILVPFFLILTGVRFLLTPTFVRIEYLTPNFPADQYGFTLDDRLKWSLLSLDYLLNDAGIEFLESLQFEDGTPIYNERELMHLVDVKNVVKAVLRVWIVSLIVIGILGIWAWQGGWLDKYRLDLVRGSWITIGFVVAVILFVLLAFGLFFVFFHEIFFDPGTWTFRYSDTLIRLFPERFWRDCFIAVGAISVIEALGVIFFAGHK